METTKYKAKWYKCKQKNIQYIIEVADYLTLDFMNLRWLIQYVCHVAINVNKTTQKVTFTVYFLEQLNLPTFFG